MAFVICEWRGKSKNRKKENIKNKNIITPSVVGTEVLLVQSYFFFFLLLVALVAAFEWTNWVRACVRLFSIGIDARANEYNKIIIIKKKVCNFFAFRSRLGVHMRRSARHTISTIRNFSVKKFFLCSHSQRTPPRQIHIVQRGAVRRGGGNGRTVDIVSTRNSWKTKSENIHRTHSVYLRYCQADNTHRCRRQKLTTAHERQQKIQLKLENIFCVVVVADCLGKKTETRFTHTHNFFSLSSRGTWMRSIWSFFSGPRWQRLLVGAVPAFFIINLVALIRICGGRCVLALFSVQCDWHNTSPYIVFTDALLKCFAQKAKLNFSFKRNLMKKKKKNEEYRWTLNKRTVYRGIVDSESYLLLRVH